MILDEATAGESGGNPKTLDAETKLRKILRLPMSLDAELIFKKGKSFANTGVVFA